MAKARKALEISQAGYLNANVALAMRSGNRVVIITDFEGNKLIASGLEILSPDDQEATGSQERAVSLLIRPDAEAEAGYQSNTRQGDMFRLSFRHSEFGRASLFDLPNKRRVAVKGRSRNEKR